MRKAPVAVAVLGLFLTLVSVVAAPAALATTKETNKHCAAQLSHAAANPNPLFSDFPKAREAVVEALRERAKLLELSRKVRNRVIELVDLPEHRQYFNSELAPILFHVTPEELTYDHLRDKFLAIYLAKQSERMRPRSLRERVSEFTKSAAETSLIKTKQLLKDVRSYIVMGAVIAAAAPINQPISAFSNSHAFQNIPGLENLVETLSADRLDEDSHSMLNEIYLGVNEDIPLTQREGRAYYYEAVALMFQIDQAYLFLREHRPPAGSPREEAWKQRVRVLRGRMADMPNLFPDVFNTGLGREELLPLVNEIVAEMDADCPPQDSPALP